MDKNVADMNKLEQQLAKFNYTLSANMTMLNERVKGNVDNLTSHSQDAIDWENRRAVVTLVLFSLVLVSLVLTLVGYFKKIQRLLLGVAIGLLFLLPLLLIFEGITASYYFVYSDVCTNVNNAIYKNAFPIPDKGIGYYVSCFDGRAKSRVFYLRYELDGISANIAQKLEIGGLTEQQTTDLKGLQENINATQTNSIEPLVQCELVYSNVQKMEETICLKGMNWSYNLLTGYTWLFLVILLTSYSVNRLSPIVWKKQVEIESMLEQEEQFD
jgi:hypothetical protein